LTYLSFAIKAAALALREHPIVNASLDVEAQEIVLHGTVNIGIATATPDGLIVPVLHSVSAMTLLEIQQGADRLAARARERSVTPEELQGGTFTITNFGALGGRQAAPIIRPGEAAVLGIGRIEERRGWLTALLSRPVMALSSPPTTG
jgi:pyruvate dehydrogenase E2 component (dihydrolipoamide acetyltransferase)